MKRGQSFGLEEFVRIAFSIIIAMILLSVLLTVYLWWVGPGLKDEATAENVVENLANLINAQEGDWKVKTFVSPPKSFSIVGFGEQTSFVGVQKPSHCMKACICAYKDFEKKPELLVCRDVAYNSVQGETWVEIADRSVDEESYSTTIKRQEQLSEGFLIKDIAGECDTYTITGGNPVVVKLSC